MNPFEMVIAIVLIACAAGVVNNWIKIKSDAKEARNAPSPVSLEELARLEKRIRVLEKIVTDKQYDLKRELHELESESYHS